MLVHNNVDSVIASDGTVKNRSIFVNYLWSDKKYRDNYGYIQYTKNSYDELEWNVLGNKFSVKSVLNKAKINLGEST